MDIKLVEHAKDYIDDLAKGINPFTKEEVNDEDIINNVKISRCLFFVSEVLEEVIKNGGAGKAPRKPKKEPFNPDAVDLSGYVFSDIPVNISDIASQINSFRPENMSRLKVTALTDWLVDMKLLEITIYRDKTRKYPTAQGNAMGITKEERMGIHGLYSVVLYDEAAQRLIVDNLSGIVEQGYNNTKKRSETADEGAEDKTE